jgi:ABC-type Mn2+/Zn2+ transport system ATPase subunit
MQPAEVLVKATGLALGYAQSTVLHNVNLEVRAGEFWFCLGLNGAGKTTLLQALLGVHRPTMGELWFHPHLVGRQRVGFVPQQCQLTPTLSTTVQEFVLLGTVGTPQRRRERHVNYSGRWPTWAWKAWPTMITGRSPEANSNVPWWRVP